MLFLPLMRCTGFAAALLLSLPAAAPRVRQLRTQLYDFIDVGFETCPYNRLSCCD